MDFIRDTKPEPGETGTGCMSHFTCCHNPTRTLCATVAMTRASNVGLVGCRKSFDRFGCVDTVLNVNEQASNLLDKVSDA